MSLGVSFLLLLHRRRLELPSRTTDLVSVRHVTTHGKEPASVPAKSRGIIMVITPPGFTLQLKPCKTGRRLAVTPVCWTFMTTVKEGLQNVQ